MFVDFTGQYRTALMQAGKSNMPFMKRIINNQVFLEESEPIANQRRNFLAMEAANQMVHRNADEMYHTGEPMHAMYTSLHTNDGHAFAAPITLAPYQGPVNMLNQPTSYMTQGQYSNHPIFHT